MNSAEPGGQDWPPVHRFSRVSEPDKRKVMEVVRAHVVKLGLPVESLDSYPHQLSGGMRQRMMIALATFFRASVDPGR